MWTLYGQYFSRHVIVGVCEKEAIVYKRNSSEQRHYINIHFEIARSSIFFLEKSSSIVPWRISKLTAPDARYMVLVLFTRTTSRRANFWLMENVERVQYVYACIDLGAPAAASKNSSSLGFRSRDILRIMQIIKVRPCSGSRARGL